MSIVGPIGVEGVACTMGILRLILVLVLVVRKEIRRF